MRIISLQLRNYRVYQELDLELPGGVVGIYGANGSGKSTLLESITWVLFGKARTQKQQLPASGSTGECSVTLVFEHEGHHYTVRRSISGAAYQVKARVTVGEQVAADGPTDVDRYLQSVLGMDSTAFRASVFAEQKQLAAFSDQAPDKRRQMVLQLLGITPVERARDHARLHAREQQAQLDRAAPLLASVADAEAHVVQTLAAVAAARDAEAAAAATAAAAQAAFKQAHGAVEALSDARAADALIRERGNAVRARIDDLNARLQRQQSQRDQAMEEHAELLAQDAVTDDVDQLATIIELHRSVHTAQQRLSKLKVPTSATGPTDESITNARAEAESLAERQANLRGQLVTATERLQVAQTNDAGTAHLDGADGCPLCGQQLGEGVDQMRRHRRDELSKAISTAESLQASLAEVQPQLEHARQQLKTLEAAAQQASAAAAEHARISAERAAQQQLIDDGLSQLGLTESEMPDAASTATLQSRVSAAKVRQQARANARARLERLPAIQGEIDELAGQLQVASADRVALLAELKALNFEPSLFSSLVAAGERAERTHDTARATAVAAGRALATEEAFAKAAQQTLDAAQTQHVAIAEQRAVAAILMRTASLLHDFRQYIVGLVGPQLQVQASELFNQLTGHEYDGLEVDPETYEMRVIDHGTAHPMARFSGSEIDLANLALRVAISEQVRFQAGGQVGLLVLDEALSSLDADRKDRTLAALAQLGGRFQQILVVTHAPEVKEQLPQAIEVLRIGLRQSTARVVETGV